ncbi:calcium-binding protein [Yoonia sp. 208BN28-4]|uniref:calcium-binding protein n=1 Tax=Yoonia sp. 208BN28-4 TaxID=3126505 RepID=UPI0030973B4F
MPIDYITTSQSTPVTVENGDIIYVLGGANITSQTNALETAAGTPMPSNVAITVNGGLFGLIGIDLFQTATNVFDINIHVGGTGTVQANDFGILLKEGTNNKIVNDGSIVAGGNAVMSGGGEISVVNNGTLSSLSDGQLGAIRFLAAAGGNDIREIHNTGLISSVQPDIAGSLQTIQNLNGAEFHIVNTGTIDGFNSGAISSTAVETYISNAGTILGYLNIGSATTEVLNSGLIDGDIVMVGSSMVYAGDGDVNGTIVSFSDAATDSQNAVQMGGTLISNSNGVRAENQLGDTNVIVDGQIFAGLNGLEVFTYDGIGVVRVSGSIVAGDTGIAMLGAEDSLHIVEGAVVQGGGDQLMNGLSAAVSIYDGMLDGTVTTINNYGTILADLNEVSGRKLAITDTAGNGDASIDDGLVESVSGETLVNNHGIISGDIVLGAGDDVYFGEDGILTDGSAIYLGDGDDALFGGSGRERVYDGGGDDDIETGAGNDSIRAGGGQNNYDGGEGQDYLSYYSFNSFVRLDLKFETTTGGGTFNAASNDTFTNIEHAGGTNGGGDTLIGSDGRNALFGFGGDDKLYGRSGDDKLDGGAGSDYFDGGAGTDRLFGGADADTFHFDRGEGDDLVMDFENNIDLIQFDNFSGAATNAAFLAEYATNKGNDVVFDFGSDGSLTVFNTTTGQLLNDMELV